MIPILLAIIRNKNEETGIRIVDAETGNTVDATMDSVIKNMRAGMVIAGIKEVNGKPILENKDIPIINKATGAIINSWNWIAIEKVPHGYRAINTSGTVEELKSSDPGLIIFEGVPESRECRLFEEKYRQTLENKTKIFKGTFEFNSQGQLKIRQGIKNDAIPGILIIPEGTSKIASGAFYGIKQIKKVVIPSTCTYVGEKAFDGCTELEEVEFNGYIIDLLSETFGRCNKLKTFNIFGKIENIKWGAFSLQSSKLKEIGYISVEKPKCEYGALPMGTVLRRIKGKSK